VRERAVNNWVGVNVCVVMQLRGTAVQGGDRSCQECRIRAWNEDTRGQVHQHVERGVDHGRLVASPVQLGRQVPPLSHSHIYRPLHITHLVLGSIRVVKLRFGFEVKPVSDSVKKSVRFANTRFRFGETCLNGSDGSPAETSH